MTVGWRRRPRPGPSTAATAKPTPHMYAAWGVASTGTTGSRASTIHMGQIQKPGLVGNRDQSAVHGYQIGHQKSPKGHVSSASEVTSDRNVFPPQIANRVRGVLGLGKRPLNARRIRHRGAR